MVSPGSSVNGAASFWTASEGEAEEFFSDVEE
jgi:hypothetical protein